jgi:RNA polymerase sigma factor (sigma-70 family)
VICRPDGNSWHTCACAQILPEDRATLARAAKRGDTCAARRLVEGHLWLVEHVGRTRKIRYSPDVWQAGVLGLYRAIERFDPDRGLAFDTYALWQVYAAMNSTRRKARRRGLTGGRKGSRAEAGKVHFTRCVPERTDTSTPQDEHASRAEISARLVEVVRTLEPRERQAVALKFGLLGTRELSTADASRAMGITPIAFRTLLARALQRTEVRLRKANRNA